MNFTFTGVEHEFEKIAVYEITEASEYDGEPPCNIRYELLVNKAYQQAILITQYRYEGEPGYYSAPEVVNTIVNREAFKMLTDALNTRQRTTVRITSVYGTTADYTIIKGIYSEDIEELATVLDKVKSSNSKYEAWQ